MNINGSEAVYRFVIQPITASDPRSLGYLSDAHALGLHQIQSIQCHDLYFLRGELTPQQLELISGRLLCDPVTQKSETSRLDQSAPPAGDLFTKVVEVVLRPGVTDPVAEQIVRASHLLGVDSVNAASTGLRFLITGDSLDDATLELLAKRLLVNNVIQTYSLGEVVPAFVQSAQSSGQVDMLPLRALDDEGLLNLSNERRAALNLSEMQAVREYCRREDRDLTDVEFEMLAQTWSEHCVHKTFKSRVEVKQDTASDQPYPNEYSHLFNQTIRAATREINAPWVLSAFTENAGIVEFDGVNEISFKVETHNHPSAIEPFGGANTGIGGVIRDVIGVSAKPIASTDILCFGAADTPIDSLPEGVLHPRRIASGVVAGIQDYGNKMGIPTVNGAIWYDEGYVANPLVYCGSIGIAPKGANPHDITPGDHIIVLGGRTGRDGLRGATFSSMTMNAQTGEVSGASVQIGAPVVEKGLVDVLMLARDQHLYHAITDCGAGGLSSAVGEMASEMGGDVQLADVPLKYPGLAPWEIWLSEAQERMVIAVPAENLSVLRSLCERYEVEMTDIGLINDSGRLRIQYGNKQVLDLDNQFLHHGLPQRSYAAQINPTAFKTGQTVAVPKDININFQDALIRLLSHPNIASKERVIRDYDHEVQGGTVVKPLCGIRHDGPSDGSVVKPAAAPTKHAFVVANGLNPEYGKLDAAQMTWLVIDEAVRNAVACGADPSRIALLDNFCWGDPTRPEIMGDLVASAQACYDAALRYGAPFISGKDSFNNEYLGSDGKVHAIPPTLLISSLGWMPSWKQAVTADFKQAGSLVYLVGQFHPTLGGSHFNLTQPSAKVVEGLPQCKPENTETYQAFHSAVQKGLVLACHDLSEGGLSVALAEMCMAGRLGCNVELDPGEHPLRDLFGETSGCLLVEVDPDNRAAFESCLTGVPFKHLGQVEQEQTLTITSSKDTLLSTPLSTLLQAWQGKGDRA